jgi:hypothetical protein
MKTPLPITQSPALPASPPRIRRLKAITFLEIDDHDDEREQAYRVMPPARRVPAATWCFIILFHVVLVTLIHARLVLLSVPRPLDPSMQERHLQDLPPLLILSQTTDIKPSQSPGVQTSIQPSLDKSNSSNNLSTNINAMDINIYFGYEQSP